MRCAQTTSVNLHAPLVFDGGGLAVAPSEPGKGLGTAGGPSSNERASLAKASLIVAFFLLQGGSELKASCPLPSERCPRNAALGTLPSPLPSPLPSRHALTVVATAAAALGGQVRNSPSPINVSVPFTPSANATAPNVTLCTAPNASGLWEGGCDFAIECRFWNVSGGESAGFWSTEGCRPDPQPDGTVTCSCDHLTDFIVFQFPTSTEEVPHRRPHPPTPPARARPPHPLPHPEEGGSGDWSGLTAWRVMSHAVPQLVALIAGTVKVRDITSRAWQCVASPSRSLRSAPVIWGLNWGFCIALLLLLTNAILRDRSEMALMQALVAGKNAEALVTAAHGKPRQARGFSLISIHPKRLFNGRSESNTCKGTMVAKGPSPVPASPPPSPGGDNGSKAADGIVPSPRTSAWDAPPVPPKQGGLERQGTRRWTQANRILKTQATLQVWHSGVDRWYKRLWRGFLRDHTLCAGIFARGVAGYTRAQTVMVLLNSVLLETIILCMWFAPAVSEGPMVINPVTVVISGTLSACIAIPGIVVFACLFKPYIFINFSRWLLRNLFCWPCYVQKAFTACYQHKKVAPVTDAEAETGSGGAGGASTNGRKATPKGRMQNMAAFEKLSSRGLEHYVTPVGEIDPATGGKSARTYSYASLNETLLVSSIGYTVKKRMWRAVVKILFGWLCSYLCFVGQLIVISAYGCELFEGMAYRDPTSSPPVGNTDEFWVTWGFSVLQRFVINEPMLIVIARGLPMLFATACCANCCGETIQGCLAVTLTAVVNCIKQATGR